jgi:hypothetical protein
MKQGIDIDNGMKKDHEPNHGSSPSENSLNRAINGLLNNIGIT